MLVLALSVGILAGLWTWFTVASFSALKIVVWITFIGWATFFVNGGDRGAVVKSFVPLAVGAFLGWCCIMGMNLLGGGFNLVLLSFLVGLAAFIIVEITRFPLLSSAPSQFYGFASFFGAYFGKSFGEAGPHAVVLLVVASLLAGVLVGYVSAFIPQKVKKAE
jgi:hypothetical protein